MKLNKQKLMTLAAMVGIPFAMASGAGLLHASNPGMGGVAVLFGAIFGPVAFGIVAFAGTMLYAGAVTLCKED